MASPYRVMGPVITIRKVCAGCGFHAVGERIHVMSVMVRTATFACTLCLFGYFGRMPCLSFYRRTACNRTLHFCSHVPAFLCNRNGCNDIGLAELASPTTACTELPWARRMICGHCAFEQTFAAAKPCRMCGGVLAINIGSRHSFISHFTRQFITCNKILPHTYPIESSPSYVPCMPSMPR